MPFTENVLWKIGNINSELKKIANHFFWLEFSHLKKNI